MNQSNHSISRHGQWSSRLAFILATTGAAVGLGNIWKFPYTAAENGGAAFIIVYLFCVLLIGVPVLVAELYIGRRGGKNPIDAIHQIARESGHSPKWRYLGWLGMLTLLLVLSFYSVVAGWSLAYIWKAWVGTFNGLSGEQVGATWGTFISDPSYMLVCATIFLIMTLWVVARGVTNGLEKMSNIVMPLLFAILLVLVGYATSTGSFVDALEFMFAVDWSKITGKVIIDAMGQAFFTLAIGAGAMLVYGAYLKKNISIFGAVFTVTTLDVLVAILAGLAIFPIAIANGVALQEGPGLMFVALPSAFAQMSGGQVFGSLFFILLFFAAWTSSISMAEPLVMTVVEKFDLSRIKASLVIGSIAWFIGIICILSFNLWQNILLFGEWTFFGVITNLVTNILQPTGGLLFALLAGWFIHKRISCEELGNRRNWIFCTWLFLIRFVTPIGILIIFIGAFW